MLRFKPTLIDINDESTLLELEQAEEKRKKVSRMKSTQ